MLNTKAVSGQVELWLEKFRHVAEVHVHARGGHMLKGRAVATSWEEALIEAVDRIVQQAQKLKGKWQERKREARPVKRSSHRAGHERRAGRAGSSGRGATRSRAMTLEDAAARRRAVADAFIVFRNAETDALSVMFRRKDGDLGLIEPEA